MLNGVVLLIVAVAADFGAAMASGEAALEGLQYGTAAIHFELAIEEATNEDERVEAHLHAGIAKVVLNDKTSARGHFLYVLKRQPYRILTDDESPRIRQFFNLVREELPRESPAPSKGSSVEPELLAPAPVPPAVAAAQVTADLGFWTCATGSGVALASCAGFFGGFSLIASNDSVLKGVGNGVLIGSFFGMFAGLTATPIGGYIWFHGEQEKAVAWAESQERPKARPDQPQRY